MDIKKARTLLAQARYDGEKVVLMKPKGLHSLEAAADVTARTLQRIGMDVDIQEVTWTTLTERRAVKYGSRKSRWHLFPTYFEALDAASPLTNIGIRSGTDAWFGWPKDRHVSKLVDAYTTESDPATRREKLERLHRRLFEGIPYVNIGQWSSPAAWRKEVSGLVESPVRFYWNVTKG